MSEGAKLRQRIAIEYQAAQRGLYSIAITTRHAMKILTEVENAAKQ